MNGDGCFSSSPGASRRCDYADDEKHPSPFIVDEPEISRQRLYQKQGAGAILARSGATPIASRAFDLEKYFTPEQLDEWHREPKVDDYPRITNLGAFLRSSSTDEFPQFINVYP